MRSIFLKYKLLLLISACLIFMALLIATAPTTKADNASSDFTYTVNPDGTTCTITGYNGAGGGITIPDNITSDSGTYTVTAIGNNAFAANAGITSVIIPNNVSSIGASAFSGCKTLRSAYFLGNAPSADDSIFEGCATDFTVYYTSKSTGFSDSWDGYTSLVFNPDVTFTVTFDLNGNNGTAPDKQTVFEGVKATSPDEPICDNKIFGGWYTESTCDNLWSFDSVITKDLTLYAQWKDFKGSGTDADPYQVSTPAQLNAVRNYPNACFIMTKDIDMSEATSEGGEYYNNGAGWKPIGELDGTFDGNGHKITGLMIHRPDADNVGLFDQISSSGIVKRLGIVDSNIYGGDKHAGSICARNSGSIEFCYNTGHVSGSNISQTGGIAGQIINNGMITKCYNAGLIDMYHTTYSSSPYFGGIVGECYSGASISISDCYNTGVINIISGSGGYSGGIVGCDDNSICNCYNVGSAWNALVGKNYTHLNYYSGLYFYKINDYYVGGIDSSSKTYGTSLSNEQMQVQSSFAGFDFSSVWIIGEDASYPYPELQGIPQVSLSENETDFAGGNGFPYNPFKIVTDVQLNNIRNYTWGCYTLVSDIDMTRDTSTSGAYYNNGNGFMPISGFHGVFEGNGHSITGFMCHQGSLSAGLFTSCANSSILDLNVYGADISGEQAGIILGYGINSEICGCHVFGKVVNSFDNNGSIGGIAGKFYSGGIFNCSSNTEVIGEDYAGVGGIIGNNSGGDIGKCYNTGFVIGTSSDSNTAGIAGISSGDVYDCYNAGYVKEYGEDSGAGIVSSNSGDITRSYNVGIATYPISVIGHPGVVNDCYYLLTDRNRSLTVSGATAETDSAMRQQDTYSGFDFNAVWTISGQEVYPYAELRQNQDRYTRENGVQFTGGTGMPDDPYQISTPAQLNEIRYNATKCFILVNDIDMTTAVDQGGAYFNGGLGWEPIDYFSGTLNGNGYCITGLNISRPEETNIGLVRQLMTEGKIDNLSIDSSNILGSLNIGGFTGTNNGNIDNCNNNAKVFSNDAEYPLKTYIGGISGVNNGTVISCNNTGSISVNDMSGKYGGNAAGISGQNNGSISGCSNSGNINAYYSESYASGITANNEGKINNSTNSGTVTSEGHSSGIAGYNTGGNVDYCSNSGTIRSSGNIKDCGGIFAENYISVSHCFNTGIVSGYRNVGGISGINGGLLDSCYNNGSINGSSDTGGISGYGYIGTISKCYNSGYVHSRMSAGGIAGEAEGAVYNCFNTGNIDSNLYSGGIVGDLENPGFKEPPVYYCYSAGKITGNYIGGIIGTTYCHSVHDCYYNNARNGVDVYSDASFMNVAKKSNTELRQQSTFLNFDFINTWNIVEGKRLPFLQGLPFTYTSGINIDKETVNLNTGDSMTLTATIGPSNATNKNIDWYSSDTGTVTVADGLITAIGLGTAVITAEAQDGGFIVTCDVTVMQPVMGVTLNKHTASLLIGDGMALTEEVIPNNATNQNVSWSSGDNSIASVDQSGNVTGVSKGDTTIMVTTEDGGFTDTCKVTILQPVESVTINGKPLKMNKGDTFNLTATVLPENANNKQITWSSEDEKVATVDQNGKVTILKVGDTVITAMADGKSDICNITVTPRQFNVAFYSNGNKADEKVVNEESSITQPNDLLINGYNFDGWYTDNNTFNNKWDFGSDMMPSSNLSLYAKWTPITYTVKYNINNGNNGSMDDSIFTYNLSANLKTNAYAKTGYLFSGWTLTNDGNVVYTDKANVSNLADTEGTTVTLYAKWTPIKYTIKYNINNGNSGSMDDSIFTYDLSANLKTNAFSRAGYTFSGWSLTLVGAVAYADGTSVKNLTDKDKVIVMLYAEWTPNTYKVNFNSNGGAGMMDPESFAYDQILSLVGNAFTRTGYTFAGWAISPSGNVVYGDKESISNLTADNGGSVMLYAKWSQNANFFVVTFNSQGGNDIVSKTVAKNTTITSPTPTRTGYTFAGWYKEATCKHAWNFSKNKVTGNITLYAKWNINKYAITFNSEGGGKVSSKKTNYNTIITPPKTPKRTGYTFSGWYKEPGCVTTWNFAADKVTGNMILYAKWNINTYSVKYNSKGGSAVTGITAGYNSLITAPVPQPTKDGYTFAGWYKESKCKHAWNFFSDKVKSNMTLYAKWISK